MAVSKIPKYVPESQNYMHYYTVGKNSSLSISKTGSSIYVLVSYSNSNDDFGMFRIAGSTVNKILGVIDSSVTITATSNALTFSNGKSYGLGFLVLGSLS